MTATGSISQIRKLRLKDFSESPNHTLGKDREALGSQLCLILHSGAFPLRGGIELPQA